MCGCKLLQQLRVCPPPSTGSKVEDKANLEVLVQGAKEYQKRWGCPGAGFKPPITLDPDLLSEAKHVATLTQTPVGDTCPMACLLVPSPWVHEMTWAVSRQKKMGVALETSLGRDLTLADLAALDTLLWAQSEAEDSNQAIAEQQREAEIADAKARALNDR